MSDEKPVDRRNFFRHGLRELLKPLASALAPLEEAAHQLGRLEHAPAPKPVLNATLRPPGARPEQLFKETCSRSGECVKVCPAQCIKIDASGAKGGGAAYIDVNAMPCVVCDGLYCMAACPSGALVPTPLVEIDMGTAQWKQQTCVRTHGRDCTICIDDCPLGTAAIELKNGRVHVIEDGCIGCGVCQAHCPTTPKSIVVLPVASRR